MNTSNSKQPEPSNEAEREAGFVGAHGSADAPDFISELRDIINKHSMENASNTPDFILAQYLANCLRAWNQATQQRETWYGRDARPTCPPNDQSSPMTAPLKPIESPDTAGQSLNAAHGSATWCPMLRTNDLQISLYTDETLEIRDGQAIYAHLTPSGTADFLRWIDARDKSPNAELSDSRPL